MRRQQAFFRLSAAVAIGGLVLGPLTAPFAQAQTTTASSDDGMVADSSAPADPPSRVGRLAGLLGTVSFHTAEDTTWQAASLNYPVTTGNAFWTEPASHASLEAGPSFIVLDQQTEFEVDTLDDHTLAATQPQGEVYLRLADLPPDESAAITTPRGVITVTSAGRYAVVAGDAEQPTRLTVVEGTADIGVGDVTLHVAAHQTASITGSTEQDFQGSIGIQVNDPFLSAQLEKERAGARIGLQRLK